MQPLSRYSASISLAAIVVFLGIDWVASKTDASYESDVKSKALGDFPRQLGEGDGIWVAVRDVRIPSNQERMLDLSSYVSREFQRLGSFPSVTATLFIAYCVDARTMAGHHPPNCYPASGWLFREDETVRSAIIREDDYVVNYSVYQFRRGPAETKALTIVNGFFTAPGFFTATLEEATEHIGSVFFGRKGLFQFQILFQDLGVEADVSRYAGELINGIPSTVFDRAFDRSENEVAISEESALGAES